MTWWIGGGLLWIVANACIVGLCGLNRRQEEAEERAKEALYPESSR